MINTDVWVISVQIVEIISLDSFTLYAFKSIIAFITTYRIHIFVYI